MNDTTSPSAAVAEYSAQNKEFSKENNTHSYQTLYTPHIKTPYQEIISLENHIRDHGFYNGCVYLLQDYRKVESFVGCTRLPLKDLKEAFIKGRGFDISLRSWSFDNISNVRMEIPQYYFRTIRKLTDNNTRFSLKLLYECTHDDDVLEKLTDYHTQYKPTIGRLYL